MDNSTPFNTILLVLAINEDKKLSCNQLAEMIEERLLYHMSIHDSCINRVGSKLLYFKNK